MSNNYNYIAKPGPFICPVCLKEFLPIQGRITPFFQYVDSRTFAFVDLCFDCAKILLETVQRINPAIVAKTEKFL